MRIVLGADHAGFDLKGELDLYLRDLGHLVVDVGPHAFNPADDYPDSALAVADEVRFGRADRGILLCGSGVGASIAANKVPGIRAALCHDVYTGRQSVEHDDANVLCVGPRVIGRELILLIVNVWLDARFTGAERHRRRLGKVAAIERRFSCEPADASPQGSEGHVYEPPASTG